MSPFIFLIFGKENMYTDGWGQERRVAISCVYYLNRRNQKVSNDQLIPILSIVAPKIGGNTLRPIVYSVMMIGLHRLNLFCREDSNPEVVFHSYRKDATRRRR